MYSRGMLCALAPTRVLAPMDKWKAALDVARSGESKYKILVQAIADAYDVCPGRLAFSEIAVFAAYLCRVGVSP